MRHLLPIPWSAAHRQASIMSNFDNLPLGAVGGTSGGIVVSFTSDGQAVQGAVGGQYAAPFLSSSNGVLFGDNTISGADTTTYLTTGVGSVTLIMPGVEKYFGILWGSVDGYNTLSFYNGVNLVRAVTGTERQRERQWRPGRQRHLLCQLHLHGSAFRQGGGVELAIRFRIRQRLLQSDGPDARAQHDADRWVRLARWHSSRSVESGARLRPSDPRKRPGQPARRSMREKPHSGPVRASRPRLHLDQYVLTTAVCPSAIRLAIWWAWYCMARLDHGEPEEARVGPGPDQPPDPPQVFTAEGRIAHFPEHPSQEDEGLGQDQSLGPGRVQRMPPPVAVRASAVVHAAVDVERLQPIEIGVGRIQLAQDADETLAKLLAAQRATGRCWCPTSPRPSRSSRPSSTIRS